MVCGECRKDSGKDVNKPDIFGEPWNESPWTNFPKEYFTESPKGGMSRVVIFPLYFWKVLHFKPFKGEVPFKLGLGTVCVTTWIISSLILLFPHVQNHPCGQTSPKKKKKKKKENLIPETVNLSAVYYQRQFPHGSPDLWNCMIHLSPCNNIYRCSLWHV